VELGRTPHWVLEREVGQSYFRLRRTAIPMGDLGDIAAELEKFKKIFSRVDTSRLGLLIDLRDGPMRNDPKWEQQLRPWQKLIFTSFGRTAVLVKTPAGKLQMERVASEVAPGLAVFDDEASAIAKLQE
jgi:hypothetical protein